MTLPANANVLLVRLSAIGDCLLTLPMACAIKAHYPESRLTWVVERAASTLLQNHPAIDRLIVLPKGWLKSPRVVWDLRRQLRDTHFDVALDPQSLSKSAIIAWLSGASQRIGLAKPHGRELSLVLNRVRIEPKQEHVVDRQLEMLQAIGIRWPAVRFDLPLHDESEQKVADWLASSPCSAGFACINPGATWGSRRWPPERFGQVAAELGARHGLPSLVVWGSGEEKAWAEEIVCHSQGHATVAPNTTLLELTAVMRRATFYLGSDTGPMHMASAVGTPCIGLFGTTRPEQSGPYGPQHVRLQAYYQSGTSRERRAAANDAMRCITTDMVLDACEQLVTRLSNRSAA